MVVKRDRKYGVINIKNEVIAPFEYDSVNHNLENSIGLYMHGSNVFMDGGWMLGR